MSEKKNFESPFKKIARPELFKNMQRPNLDARNVQVLNTDDHFELFSGTFCNFAKLKKKSYVLIQFTKGNPEAAMYDTCNCSRPEALKALKAIISDEHVFVDNSQEES